MMYRSLERSPQDPRDGIFLYSAQASFSWPRVDLARLLRRASEEERIVSHDASGFILYYHFECDVIIVLQLARSESRSARYGVFPNK